MSLRVLVLGGTGFVGSHVVADLVSDGHRVVVPTRRRERSKHLLLLPTVDLVEADVHDNARLAKLVADCDAVVNLVGILHETPGATFKRVHVELARSVLEACRRSKVRRLVHMSAIGASPDAPSRYLRSKGEAQALVEASDLDWTIFRPSVIFGRGDSFIGLFAKLLRWMPVVFLAAPDAKFQPVHVKDVALCMAASVGDRRTLRQLYELCGPKVYTLREIVAWVAETTGHLRPIIGLGPALSRLQAGVLELSPVKLLTRDNLASMRVDATCSQPFPAVFGVTPSSLEAIAPEYLAPSSIRSPFDGYRARAGDPAMNDRTSVGAITLREITAETVRDVCRLEVMPEQQPLVAPNAISIAQAYFEPAAWFRAIHADDVLVGFAMLYDPTRTATPEAGPDTCFLWRFMIDHRHQRRGYGAAALDLVIAHARTLAGVTRIKTSYVPAPGNASPLYERAGFRATGELDDGEVVLELTLARDATG